jgi:hypothetical protein
MSISVELGDIGDFNRRMRQAPQIIREEMTKGVNTAVRAGQQRAQHLVGVKTGFLRGQIISQPTTFAGGTVTGSYGTNVKYARMHEEGTGPHVITATNKRALSFTYQGKRVVVRRVNHPGTKGRFYMRGSREWLEPQLGKEFQAVRVRIIRRMEG